LAAGDLFLGPYPALILALTSRKLNGFVHRGLGGGVSTARVEQRWCLDSIGRFRAAKSTMIPASFPTGRIGANHN
jgi:hypothetical protein